MEPFRTLRAIAAPLMTENTDTDILIRVERMVSGVPREELGQYCFEAWRRLPDGQPNPSFLLNQPPYQDAQILLAGANFGCGSSREPAVWALLSMGVRCIIAPSFGDIFRTNCVLNGLLPVELPLQTVEEMARWVTQDPAGHRLDVDLPSQAVSGLPSGAVCFRLPSRQREALLAGLDDIDLTRRLLPRIEAFAAADAVSRPWIYELT